MNAAGGSCNGCKKANLLLHIRVIIYDTRRMRQDVKILRTDWPELKFGYRQPAASSVIPVNPHKCCESNLVIGLTCASEICIILAAFQGCTLNVRRSYHLFSQIVSACEVVRYEVKTDMLTFLQRNCSTEFPVVYIMSRSHSFRTLGETQFKITRRKKIGRGHKTTRNPSC